MCSVRLAISLSPLQCIAALASCARPTEIVAMWSGGVVKAHISIDAPECNGSFHCRTPFSVRKPRHLHANNFACTTEACWHQSGKRTGPETAIFALQNVCAGCSVKLHPKAVAKNCYKSSLTCVHVYYNTMEYVAFVCHSVGCVLQNYLAIPESILFHSKILCVMCITKWQRWSCQMFVLVSYCLSWHAFDFVNVASRVSAEQ